MTAETSPESGLVASFRSFLEQQIWVDPLLVNLFRNALPAAVLEIARQQTDDLYDTYVHTSSLEWSLLQDIPFSPRLMRLALYEALLSTAILNRFGLQDLQMTTALPLSEPAVLTASLMLQDWLKENPAAFYLLYVAIMTHDLLGTLRFHRTIEELEFLQSSLHGYSSQSAELFLLVALAQDSVRYRLQGSSRLIHLTKLGHVHSIKVRELLEQSGYMGRRSSVAYLYHFEEAENWDDLSGKVWQRFIEIRKDFVNWLNIQPRANVLEVACGTGSTTFEAGLFEKLRDGHLTALDVSADMLLQARDKWRQFGSAKHVSFVQGSVEQLPFPDDEFDEVIGTAFLHVLSDPSCAIKEMARCTIKGGTVSVMQALEFPFTEEPFFQEWFSPITQLNRRWQVERWRSQLPTAEDIQGWFVQANLHDAEKTFATATLFFDDPARVVQHLLRSVSWFRTQMLELPWEHRKFLIEELIQRGADVCRKYKLSARTVELPVLLIRAVK